tara:strand:+ start:992 stop:1576 length:585 start_codon:yes stop_codon:yes gene_type:complete
MAEYVCADGRMSVNGICPVVNQGNDNNNITKDYSKDVKSNFQWDFDKVGNKVANFGTTIKSNINAYDSYIEDNLGISKDTSKGFRTVGVAAGVGTYGVIGALVPFAIPFMAGGALNKKQQKENERITNITNQDTQGSDNTIDMATYGIPTAGQTGFNIHNDAYDQGNSGTGSAGRGGASPGSTGPGGSDAMGSF